MTVEFALFVSPDGIALAHRQPAGHWALVAEARLDAGDLDAAMASLKAAATARGGAKAPVLIVLPDDQVLYTSFMAPADDRDLVEARITEGLEGMTPYAVSDLLYDWRAVEVDRVKVAVVARETLDEATEFAKSHGFDSAGFAAMPPAERFPAMPLFGKDRADWGIDATGLSFGSDDWVDPANAPSDPAPAAAEPETAAVATDDATDEAPPADGAPELPAVSDAPEPPAAPETVAPDPDKGDKADEADTPAPAPTTAKAPVADAKSPQTEPEAAKERADTSEELTPIEDPSLDRPVARLDTAEDDAGPDAPDAQAPLWSLLDQAHQEDETEAAPEPEAVTTTDAPPVPAPTATRGKAGAAADRPLTAEKPDAAPPRATGGPRLSATAPAGPATEPGTPALGFGARRGKAAKPDAVPGDLVSARPSRLGFGAAAARDSAPVLHPDAAAPPMAATPQARPGNKLAAHLARVRDASRLSPASPATAPAPTTEDGADIAPQTKAAQVAMPEAALAEAPLTRGLFRRSGSEAPVTAPNADRDGADTAFTSGLLARKPTEQAGPSFRTGLILTVVLLILLAVIAIWSALFLPDSPMARLFGADRDSAQSSDIAPDLPIPPAAVTAPPAMGALDPAPTAPEAAPQDVVEAPAETAVAAPEPEAEPAPAPEELADATPVIAPEPEPAPLPDIDAELDLPPLPPLPEDMLPSLEETERIYAEDGIWPRTPDLPELAPLGTLNDLYVASIDPDVPVVDAVALALPGLDPNETLRRVPAPPPFGARLDRDARGLVQPTPEGVLTPEGAFVVLGRPPVAAVQRPRELAPVAPAAPSIDVEDAILGTFTPQPRPADLDETRQRQVQGGFSDTELAALRPDPRPLSAQEAAARASLFQTAAQAPEPQDAAAQGATPPAATAITDATPLAVAASRVPTARPANIETLVAAAATAAPAVETSAVARQPDIPSSADVTRAATERNAIRLRDINLIGVTGTASDRRALVRLPSGRFVRVGVGDRLDGGRVAAIGETSLQYVRNGRNVTLDIPG